MNIEFENNTKIVFKTLSIYNEEDLKRVYHYLAKSFHPDNNEGNDEYFKHIQILYQLFSNYIKNLKNINLAKGDFYQSFNYLLNRFKVNMNDLALQKMIYEALVEYAQETHQDGLADYLNNILNNQAKVKNNPKKSLDLSGVITTKPETKMMKNKTKGILYHVFKIGYMPQEVLYKYEEMLQRATTYNDYQKLYFNIYDVYFYEPSIAKIKKYILNQVYNPKYSELASKILDAINNYPDMIGPNTLRELLKLDFNNTANVETILSSLTESKKQVV